MIGKLRIVLTRNHEGIIDSLNMLALFTIRSAVHANAAMDRKCNSRIVITEYRKSSRGGRSCSCGRFMSQQDFHS